MSSSSIPHSEVKKKKKRKPPVPPSDLTEPNDDPHRPSTSSSLKPKPPKLSDERSESRFRSPDEKVTPKKKKDKSDSKGPESPKKTPKKRNSEEKSQSRTRTPDEKSLLQTPEKTKVKDKVSKVKSPDGPPIKTAIVPPPKTVLDDKSSPSKPSPEEKTPKIRALLEDRSSKMKSPEGSKSPEKLKNFSGEKLKAKVKTEPQGFSPERSIVSPVRSDPSVTTKKTFQKSAKLNELIKQKNVPVVPVDDLQPSTSALTPAEKKQEEVGGASKDLVTAVKKKRGRPLKM